MRRTDVRPDPVNAARSLVTDRFPDAIQAWLGGSASAGSATATSDLDIVVLLADTTVRRESLTWQAWPVELFVNTEASVRHFVANDRARRRPTMARLIATGTALLDGHGGRQLVEECAAALAAGPVPADLQLHRYMLTDLRDDLLGEPLGPGGNAVAIAAWQESIELILALAGTWTGSGKWLVRELAALDRKEGTTHVELLDAALRAALAGERQSLIRLVEEILITAGGTLRAGFRQDADLPVGYG